MKKLEKNFLTIMLIFCLTTTPAAAQPAMEVMTTPGTITKQECEDNISAAVSVNEMLVVMKCQEVLQAADDYINAQKKEVTALQDLVSQQDALLASQQRRLTDFESRNEKWYNNPIYIGALGILAGGLTVMMLEN